MSTRKICSRQVASAFVQQIADRAGLTRTDRVLLVGCDQIEVLIQLAHRGFADVTCRSLLAGPSIEEKSADIVIAPALESGGDCAVALIQMERVLRPSGVLFLGIRGSPLKTETRQTQRLLRQLGFTFLQSYLKDGLHLLSCRKVPLPTAQAA